MKLDPHEVGRRIREAREAKGMDTPSALAVALRERTGTTKPDKETVRLWEKGAHIPPYGMLEYLVLVLGEPEEFILFGIQKDESLRDQRTLEYVSPEEIQLLNSFRHTAKDHRKDTLEHANMVAKNHPAPLAQVRKFPGRPPP